MDASGRFTLVLQGSDGNLVSYMGATPLWATGTVDDSSAVAVMQDDGDFELLDETGKVLWSSGTGGNPGAVLAVQDDGDLVVYLTAGKPIWASNTCCH